MFFEAVNEFGRDFENIQQYINSKLKKKGAGDEQMRSKLNGKQPQFFVIDNVAHARDQGFVLDQIGCIIQIQFKSDFSSAAIFLYKKLFQCC